MYETIAKSILCYFHYETDKLYLLVDEAYAKLAKSIHLLHKNAVIQLISTDVSAPLKTAFCLPDKAVVLLLAEPETYIKYKLFQHFDFSEGEPKILGTSSRVLIFPKESICRIFSGSISKSISEKKRIQTSMDGNQKYRITTAKGTDLVFESRHWIPLDFEVCTAPVETSINGTIVVDGALFFKKIEDTLTFEIKDGKIVSITADSEAGKSLVAEYKKMTAGTMKNPSNTQLAEIGIGFMDGAAITDCFMEAEIVSNTCHFCFGHNVCYGGENESEFHGASVLIREPMFSPKKRK